MIGKTDNVSDVGGKQIMAKQAKQIWVMFQMLAESFHSLTVGVNV